MIQKNFIAQTSSFSQQVSLLTKSASTFIRKLLKVVNDQVQIRFVGYGRGKFGVVMNKRFSMAAKFDPQVSESKFKQNFFQKTSFLVLISHLF